MSEQYEVVVLKIKRAEDGLYTATSSDLAGVCVVHRSKDRIIEDMPNIVRLWYKRNRGVDVTAAKGLPVQTYEDRTFIF